MKFIIFIIFIGFLARAFADCDIKPLKQKIISQYRDPLPVTNVQGEIGKALAKKFVVSDYLVNIHNESFLIANFELDIKWLKGKTQTIKTLVVATINVKTCTIEDFKSKASVARTDVPK